MATQATFAADQVDVLRARHYNARVMDIQYCHDDLMILRVRPDRGVPNFSAGQYTVLGLGNWEPRVEGVQLERDHENDIPKLIKRAYSMSCSLLDDRGRLQRAASAGFLEFYITLVRFADQRAPALTPRLFALRFGDRLFCGPHVHGHYTLDQVRGDDNVILAATGTGEAPHNAMLAELLATGHRGRITMTTCVRRQRDLGYLQTHRRLEQRYPGYQYLPLTTREPKNMDPHSLGYVGKRYLQEYFESGDFERDAGNAIDPTGTHVFVCGGPEMIGVPHRTHDPARRYPSPKGLVEVLEQRGLRVDQPHEPGNIHFEKYW